jgi:aminopeptidase N
MFLEGGRRVQVKLQQKPPKTSMWSSIYRSGNPRMVVVAQVEDFKFPSTFPCRNMHILMKII